MLKLILKPQAEDDLSKIYEYTVTKWSFSQADIYQDELFDAMTKLTTQPEMGKEYLHGTQPYRQIHINRHLIFYRTADTKCIIVRILHDSMDVEKRI